MARDILVLKITLLGCKPPIWRKVLVPITYTFSQLHEVIRCAMPWAGYHLHCFNVYPKGSRKSYLTIGQMTYGAEDLDESITHINEFLRHPKDKVIYLYDFGDSWEHKVEVLEVVAREDHIRYPYCAGGRRAAPPEDCGGSDGFADLLEARNNPNHPEHEEIKEWLSGTPWENKNPAEFNLQDVNNMLIGL